MKSSDMLLHLVLVLSKGLLTVWADISGGAVVIYTCNYPFTTYLVGDMICIKRDSFNDNRRKKETSWEKIS